MKKTKRLLAMMLTLILCLSEVGSTGLCVFAAEEEDNTTEAVTEEEIVLDGDLVTPAEEDFSQGEGAEIYNEEGSDTSDEEKSETSDEEGSETYDEEVDTESAPDEGDITVETQTDGSGTFEKTADNTMFGTAGMASPRVPTSDTDEWQGSYVYYGKYAGDPVKYRVLDKETAEFNKSGVTDPTMLLDCDLYLYETYYDNVNSFPDKNLDGDGFLTMSGVLTDREREAITESYKAKRNNKDGDIYYTDETYTPLDGDKIFVLSLGEAARTSYGYLKTRDACKTRNKGITEDVKKKGENGWWLRDMFSVYQNHQLYAYKDGTIDYTRNNNGGFINQRGISPAFNVDLSHVMFSSAVSGAKGETNTSYKLTLATDTFSAGLNSKATVEGKKLSIPYTITGTNADDVNAVSVLIIDRGYNTKSGNNNKGNIIYYGKLDTGSTFSKTGTGTVTLPDELDISEWGVKYRVYLLAEQMNGSHETDYAGAPVEISESSLKIVPMYSVNFNMNGKPGTAPVSQTVAEGKYATKPADPETEGYTFKGWYSGGFPYDFSTPVTSDITLYALWEEVKYNLWIGGTRVTSLNQDDILDNGKASYDPKNNTLTLKNLSGSIGLVNDGNNTTAIYNKDIDGLTITGKADLTGNTGDFAIESASGKLILEDADLKLKGKYSAIKADKLIFNGGTIKAVSTANSNECDAIYAKNITLNKGKVETEIDGQLADGVHAETITVNGGLLDAFSNGASCTAVYVEKSLVLNDGEINANAYDMEDYAYGICGKYNGTTTLTVNGGKIYSYGSYSGIENFKGGITLRYSVEIINPVGGELNDEKSKVIDKNGGTPSEVEISDNFTTYTVTFNMNGHGTAIDPVEVKEGWTVEAPDGADVEGYTFEGWFTDADCTTAYVFTTPVNEDITLYAGWKGVDRTVTFDMGGKATNVTANVENGQPVSRPATDPEAEGYIFTGWFEDEDCTTEYDFTRVITKNTTIFAGWRVAAKFTVVFSANKVNATNMPADKIVVEGKTVTKPAADPKADGYSFTGWYADTDCTTSYTFTEPVTETTIIYAGWKEGDAPAKGVTVSFNMMDHGTAIPAQTVSENGKVEKPDNPAEEGWVFGGWFKDKELTEIYDFDTPVTADMILYAKWYDKSKVTVYTVSFNMMDHGTDIKPVEVVSGNVLPIPKSPVEEGWKFEGWFKEEGCVNEYNFNDPVKENFTLYAKWTEEKEAASKGISALDNRPVINETTTDIYLVKGQKFFIGKDWAVVDKVAKTYVSIDKKGYLKAKKPDPESVTVKIKKEGRADITVHICQPALSDKKMTLEITNETPNPTQTLTITKDNGIKNVLWYSAAPDVATVDQNGKVTAVAKGKAKITAYVNGKAYNCNITVKESVVAKNRTLHVNLQASKKISVRGVKNWIGADETIAENVNNADKFKAMKVGKTVLSASVNDIKYTIDFYAEDITVNGEKVSGGNKNKYTIDNLQVGTATDISLPGVKQDVVFKSSKPDVVFIDEKGHIEARSKGKAKLTTKINGKTITITVSVVE